MFCNVTITPFVVLTPIFPGRVLNTNYQFRVSVFMKIRVEKDKVQYFSELNDMRASVDQLSNEKVRIVRREISRIQQQTNATNSFVRQLETVRETETANVRRLRLPWWTCLYVYLTSSWSKVQLAKLVPRVYLPLPSFFSSLLDNCLIYRYILHDIVLTYMYTSTAY